MAKIIVERHGIKTEIENSICSLQKGDILYCKIYTPRSFKYKLVKVNSISIRSPYDAVCVELLETDKDLANYKDPYFRKKMGDIFIVRPNELRSLSC